MGRFSRRYVTDHEIWLERHVFAVTLKTSWAAFYEITGLPACAFRSDIGAGRDANATGRPF